MSIWLLWPGPRSSYDAVCPADEAQLRSAIEHTLWSSVQAILPQVNALATVDCVDAEPLEAAAQAFFVEMLQEQDAAWGTYIAKHLQSIQHALLMEQADQVQAAVIEWEARRWRVYQNGRARYEDLAKTVSPFLEFMVLLRGYAIPMRRLYRRDLRRRFHCDVRRWRSRGPRHRSLSKAEVEAMGEVVDAYHIGDDMFISALMAVKTAERGGRNCEEACIEAVTAMRRAMFESTIESTANRIVSEDPLESRDATMQLAGWVRSQIRLFPSHRAVLRTASDLHTVFSGILPELVSSAYRDNGGPPSELLQTVRRRVDQLRQRSPRRGRPPQHDSKRDTIEASKQHPAATLEDWQAQEELRLNVKQLTVDAKLSPQEARVLDLRVDGQKFKDIAADLGVTLGTVTQQFYRAQKKLKKSRTS